MRMTVGAYVQPAGSFDAVRPLVNAELGLGRGFTLGVGTTWFGGDAPNTADGLTPYAQVRYQLFGRRDGTGWQGGVALAGKRVGWHNGDVEAEASFSLHYRAPRWEVGAQGTFGQSLVDGAEHDLEARAFAAWRPTPALALGVAAQLRVDVGNESPARGDAARAGPRRGRRDRRRDGELHLRAMAGGHAGRREHRRALRERGLHRAGLRERAVLSRRGLRIGRATRQRRWRGSGTGDRTPITRR
ncbi:MAG: hypothetical protein IPF99_33065 [Deltaproteobacteria bacterium]|nr:hypothetical protein [Deltaproteobacteria bacterium]